MTPCRAWESLLQNFLYIFLLRTKVFRTLFVGVPKSLNPCSKENWRLETVSNETFFDNLCSKTVIILKIILLDEIKCFTFYKKNLPG